jgi:hypothetical protein
VTCKKCETDQDVRISIVLMWLRIPFSVRGPADPRFIQEGGKFLAYLRYDQILRELNKLPL